MNERNIPEDLDTTRIFPKGLIPEEDAFDTIASAVEGLVEEEFAGSVYPGDEAAFDTGEDIPLPSDLDMPYSAEEDVALPAGISIPTPEAQEPPRQQLETPEMGRTLTAADTVMRSAGLAHPSEVLPAEDAPAERRRLKKPFREKAYREQDNEEFRQMFDRAAPESEDIPKHDRPAHKGRPRRRKGPGLLGIPHLIAAVIWLMIILAIGVSLGRVIWVCAADLLAFGRESKEVTVTINKEDSIEVIADKLHDAGLIRYPDLFLLYADLTDVVEDGEISTGTFTLNTIYDYHALVSAMSPNSGSRAVIEDVLIPEGYSCRQIFALLESKGICKVADLEEYAANGEFSDYWFLEGVERGDKYCLEGFLFPDTYDFYENSTPREALGKMLSGFNYRFTEELYAQLPALNERISNMMVQNGESAEYIAAHQLDLRGLLTVASLIEEETANNSESYNIASVIYNRLYSWGDNPRYLNIDAAIFYALGEHKEALTAEDLQIDSPYNTYSNTGLVPGPISNPGLASIQAALDPASTNYYYYVLDPTVGSHVFTSTYEQHEAARAEISKKVTENG